MSAAAASARAAFGLALPLLLLLGLPLLGLVTATEAEQLSAALSSPTLRQALWLSLWTSAVSLVFVAALGLPLAMWLALPSGAVASARGRRARTVVSALVQLPIVLPPAVVGLGLLLSLGKGAWLGERLHALGLSPMFNAGAIVIAQVVVSAPFFVQTARVALARVDADRRLVAATLGAGPRQIFARVVLPTAWPGLLAGASLAWARAMGEFGATMLFAGNVAGRTQTMPLAIYNALDGDLAVAVALALILSGVAVLALVGARRVAAGVGGPA